MISTLTLSPTLRVLSMRATWAAPGQSRCGTTSALTAILRVSSRPWPLSVISAVARSGGRAAFAVPVSAGGKIAETLGDRGFQSWLVVLHHEEIMAVGIADVATDLALAEDRVAGDDRAVERQALEQHHGGADLVLVGLDHEIADHGAELGGEGGEHVQRLGIEPSAAFQRLAVDRDVPGSVVAERELAQRRGERVGVERLEEIVERRMAGRHAVVDAEQAQRLRLQPTSPAEDRDQIIGAGQHRSNRNAQ